jgi:hypothetical protein
VTLEPTSQLDERQTQDLQTALAIAQPALTEAHKLIDLPDGRYPYTSTPDGGITTNSPSVGLLHRVPIVLYFDVLLRGQQGDADGALASCRGMLNVGRSAGDDLTFHIQLARMAIRSSCCGKIERVLAQGQPSEAALTATQRLLEREEAVPLFLIGARGQRAGWHRMLETLHDGQLPGIGNGLKGNFFSTATFSSRPTLLYVNTRIVEIAKLPVEQQLQRLKEEGLFARQRLTDYPIMARVWLLPRVEKITTDLARGQARTQAELRSAIAALAAERYHRVHDNWPSDLDALVPSYLPKVPTDPFDGQPLRLRRLETGVVIYSVGPDGQDNDGKINRATPEAAGTDLGFQLWDEPHRRQPPKQ